MLCLCCDVITTTISMATVVITGVVHIQKTLNFIKTYFFSLKNVTMQYNKTKSEV